MHAVRWIIVAIISVMFGFANLFCVSAAPMQQAEPSVEITITTAQTEITVGESMTWLITLAPNRRQRIDSIKLQSSDPRVWKWPDGIQTVGTFTSTVVLTISAVPLVDGILVPVLEAHYTANEKDQTQLVTAVTPVQAEPVKSEETASLGEIIIGRIPDELFGIVVGLIAGVLSTFFVGLAGDLLARTLQKKVNRRQVYGLLRLIARESEYAANNGVKVALEPLEATFKEEGLFTVLQKYELSEDTHDLWNTAKRHNDGLNAPGGAQRAESLRKDAQKVKTSLQKIRNR